MLQDAIFILAIGHSHGLWIVNPFRVTDDWPLSQSEAVEGRNRRHGIEPLTYWGWILYNI